MESAAAQPGLYLPCVCPRTAPWSRLLSNIVFDLVFFTKRDRRRRFAGSTGLQSRGMIFDLHVQRGRGGGDAELKLDSPVRGYTWIPVDVNGRVAVMEMKMPNKGSTTVGGRLWEF